MELSLFDVIIIGGGIAGCSTALSLIRSNPEASFLLIDDADPTCFKIGESLPAEANRFLYYLSPSISDRLSQDTSKGLHTTCTGNASVWESTELHETYSIMNPFGSGWHLDRALFDESLREHVQSTCCADESHQNKIIKGKFVSVRKDGLGWIVTVDISESNLNEYRSKWLVDASGRKASVARKLNAKTIKLDGLVAFYSVFHSTSLDLDHRTFIEATETGWWYTSQLSDHKRIVVFHTDDRDPPSKLARKQEGFLDILHTATTHISKIIEDNDYRLSGTHYPRCTAANSSYLEPFGSEDDRWCAVGDAAIAFDPLSSQGMITAIKMGCSIGIILSNQISASREESTGTTINLDSVFKLYKESRLDYEKKRKYFYTQSMFSSEFWQRRK